MDMRFSPVFWKLAAAARSHPRYISMPGGTRSGKTYSVLQYLHLVIPKVDRVGDITSVVSETLPHLKRGAVRDFERIVGHPLSMDPRWNASENVYTYDNGARLEFFSADSSGKVLGPARKRLFVNECNHIDYETARQLFVRTTELIILDYNPAATFWCVEKIEERTGCVTIRSTYKDNPFLTPEQIAEIEANRDDRDWWTVYGEGKLGKLEGLIYAYTKINALPEVGGKMETWGLDFGFTNDPTALVHCLIDTGRKHIYLDEDIYERGLLNDDIAAGMAAAGVPKHSTAVYADAAEPKTIETLCQFGYNVLPCVKAKKAEQIQSLRGYKIFVTKRSLNTIKELDGYVWMKDKDGNPTNEPIPKRDHAMDAFRYGVYTPIYGEGDGSYMIS